MKLETRRLSAILILALFASSFALVYAVPQPSHKFWGDVTIDGVPASDGTLVEAKIAGVTYETELTVDGKYGYTISDLFYVPADDPDTIAIIEGGVTGDTVEFYVGGELAATSLFEVGGTTSLDLTGMLEITVSTDEASYLADELVTISGVADVDAFVAIDVKNPIATSIYFDTVAADGSGAYSTMFRLPVDAMTGTYTVYVSITGATASTTFIVIETGTLNISTTPVAGEVFVDGVSWGVAPQSRDIVVGGYTVTFGDVAGYTTPGSVSVIVVADMTADITGTYVEIVVLPAETTGEETLDSTGAPKTSFALGETVLASAEVSNVGVESQMMLIIVQLTDPDYRVLPPSYISVTLLPGQSLTPSIGFLMPLTGYSTGTWTAKIMVLDTWPALGGVPIGDPITITFTVS